MSPLLQSLDTHFIGGPLGVLLGICGVHDNSTCGVQEVLGFSLKMIDKRPNSPKSRLLVQGQLLSHQIQPIGQLGGSLTEPFRSTLQGTHQNQGIRECQTQLAGSSDVPTPVPDPINHSMNRVATVPTCDGLKHPSFFTSSPRLEGDQQFEQHLVNREFPGSHHVIPNGFRNSLQ